MHSKRGVGRNITARWLLWEPSSHGVSSISTVLYELPGHVTRPSAFQTAANVTFKDSGHASVEPIKMQKWDVAWHYLQCMLHDATTEWRVIGRLNIICMFFAPTVNAIIWKNCLDYTKWCWAKKLYPILLGTEWYDLSLKDCSGLTHLTLHLYGKPTGYQYYYSYNPSSMASEIRTHCFTALCCSGLCLKRETKNCVCNLQITSRTFF